MERTYESIKKEIEKIESNLKIAEDECAKKGMPFDAMIESTKEDRLKIFSLDKEARLLQDPAVQYKKKWKGELIPMERFVDLCEEIDDEDGYGLYATETSVSDVKIYPSDVTENKYRTDFTHVMWFEEKK